MRQQGKTISLRGLMYNLLEGSVVDLVEKVMK